MSCLPQRVRLAAADRSLIAHLPAANATATYRRTLFRLRTIHHACVFLPRCLTRRCPRHLSAAPLAKSQPAAQSPSAPSPAMSSSIAADGTTTSWVDENPDKRRDIITRHAYMAGIKAGSIAMMFSAPAVYVANRNWRAFRTRLNVSAKTALVISPFLGAFSLVSERRLAAAAQNPKLYMEHIEGQVADVANPDAKLKLWQRAANHVFDHPYKTLVSVSVPLVGAIYAAQHANKNITVSQQIMTTRIYGQASVVVLLLSSMAFHDYMSKHGRFEVEAEGKHDNDQ